MDEVLAIERRRRNLRIVLFVIILATLPFYCAGFLLWATAERGGATAPIGGGTATATYTPISIQAPATRTLPGIITPLPFGTPTSVNPLQPTPGQFIPIPVTRFLSPTAIFLPTLTLAPTLTPFPPFEPPTATPFVLPTLPPQPTQPPIIIDPTKPPDTPIPFPTDTLIPPAPIEPTPGSPGG
ncbi:MAG: hypothetical protein SF123_09195 [Chloroflexota bacterium]|nr:hypothetical protein [Chloroflexota bacterium]